MSGLEEIKKELTELKNQWNQGYVKNADYAFDIADNLISRVEELEKEIEGRKKFELGTVSNLKILRIQNQFYRQALEFYADESNYDFETIVSDCDIDIESKILNDGGEKAREALKEESQ